MPVFNNALAGGSFVAAGGYQIERSLRFNSGDSAYLNKTPSSAGNRKTWTWSGWFKRAPIGGFVFGAGSGLMAGGAHTAFMFTSDKLQAYDYTGSGYAYNIVTTRVFRDPSAWYHIVLAIDTTQSTSTDRVKLYINGVLQTALDTTTYPSQNYETYVNTASLAHQISHTSDGYNGYLADVHFIDGQALAPTDFGETDDNNVWQPKKFAGTYGTNGFHLDFKDNSSNAALGTDTSGNSNTWTVNNLSALGGVKYSALVQGTLDTAYGSSDPATAFNGSIGNNYTDGIRPTSGNYLSINFGSEFSSASTVQIYGHASLDGVAYNGANENLKINGTALTSSQWDETVAVQVLGNRMPHLL